MSAAADFERIATGEKAETGGTKTPSRRLRAGALAGVGLALGVGITVLLGEDPPGRAHHPPSVDRFDFTDGTLVPVTAGTGTAVPVPVLATEPASAEAALQTYLGMLVEARLEPAYALLDAPSRRRFPTEASWRQARATLVSPTSFEIGLSRRAFADPDAVEIEVAAVQAPSLDAVRGLVPARSRQLWSVRREEGRWRVSAEPAQASAVLPPDAEAAGAVDAWVRLVAACDQAGALALQASSYLYGPAEVAAEPCAQRGVWTVGSPGGLDRVTDPRDFLAAFGPDVTGWARTVPVAGPGRRFLAVVAPIGDAWRVMGVALGS